MVKRQSTVWVDAGGRTVVSLLTTSAGCAAVLAEIAALSNAAVQQSWEGDLTVVAAPSPVAATFLDVADYALLQYQTASGSLVGVRILAPHSGIFMADGVTVDPASLAALNAVVLTDVVTPAGVALTAYVSGLRQRSR